MEQQSAEDQQLIANSKKFLDAAKAGDDRVVAALLHLVDSEVKDATGRTALVLACANGQVSTAAVLIEGGASLAATSNQGSTPLMAASGNGHLPIVQLLLEKGAGLHAVNVRGATALICASEEGHAATAQCTPRTAR